MSDYSEQKEKNERLSEDDFSEFEKPRPKSSKPRKKKRRRKFYFLRFLLFCIACFLIYRGMDSSYFTLKNFKVSGNMFYTPAQIIDMSGLQTGVNLFFEIKTRPARDKLLEDPYIKLADIRRRLPDTIEINITERVEYAAVPYEKQYVLIDSSGMVLRISDIEPALPLLGNMSISDMTPGKPLQVDQAYMLTDTLELLQMVEENDIYFKRVDFSTVIIRAYIYDELYCEGTPSNITENMESLQKLLQKLYRQDVSRGVIRVGNDGYLAFSPTE